jgi:putative methanogenesis marker domain 9
MLKIGYLNLDNPIAIISKESDFRDLDSQASPNGSAGLVMLGRFNLDEVDPSEMKATLDRHRTPSALGFSTVGGELEDLLEVAEMAAEEGRLMEVELSRTDGIIGLVREIKSSGAALSVRTRPGAIEDLRSLARELKEGGADLLHLDLRGLGPEAPKVVKRVSDGGAPKLMVRSDVGDFQGARDLLSMGADMISLSDEADPEFVAWLADALKRFHDLVGWYNAPKHICSGGDLRGIAFCCPPVKNCPLLGALKKINVSPKEFIERKLALTKGTPLEPGDGTCFGSLAWCCKITKPCFMRDAVLDRHGISPDEYMRLKKRLAEDLLKA